MRPLSRIPFRSIRMDIPPPALADYSLRRYLVEAFEVVTSADSRLVRTFRALLTRPGELTAAYFSTRADGYLRPQQVLLFCSVAFFFVQPLIHFNALTSPLRVHVGQTPYQRWAASMVEAEVARRGGGMEAYRTAFDAAVDANARSLAFLLVPIFAALMAVVFVRSRRYFVQHLVFATHFIAFLLLTMPLLALALFAAGRLALSAGAPAGVVGAIADWQGPSVYCTVYLALALRRAYGEPRVAAAARGIVLALGMMVVLTVYRGVLFLATFHGL